MMNFRQILFSQVQFTNQHTINMKRILILILLAAQKMAISSETNKKSTAIEWWKGTSSSFLPSFPAAFEEKQNKEEGPDHLTNGRHGILSIYFPFPRSFCEHPHQYKYLSFQGQWKLLKFGWAYYICICAGNQKGLTNTLSPQIIGCRPFRPLHRGWKGIFNYFSKFSKLTFN